MTPTGILLKNFFPFLKKFSVLRIGSASNFDFSLLKEVNLSAMTFQKKDKHDYLLFCIPRENNANNILSNFSKMDSNIKNNLKAYGYEIDDIIIKNAGLKNLSASGDSYKKSKYIVTISDTDNNNFYIILSEYFFNIIMWLSGAVFQKADSGKLNNLIDIPEILDKSILHSHNRLFFNNLKVLSFIQDDADRSNFLNEILQTGFVDYNHLASAAIFFKKWNLFLEDLPETIKKIIFQLKSDLEPLIKGNKNSHELWKCQLSWHLHNILSLMINKKNTVLNEIVLDDNIHSNDIGIALLRLNYREKRFSFKEILEYFAGKKNAEFLIRDDIKIILINLKALGHSYDLNVFFKLFGSDFKDYFESNLRKKSKKFENISENERERLLLEYRIEFYQKADAEMKTKYIAIRTPLGIKQLFEMIKNFDEERSIILYNEIGFEKFVSFFEIFRYSKDSPLNKDDAIVFFKNLVALLPALEASICREIFFERLNRGRRINETQHDNAIKSVSQALMYMQQLKLSGEKND
jgi:hypothetical protein